MSIRHANDTVIPCHQSLAQFWLGRGPLDRSIRSHRQPREGVLHVTSAMIAGGRVAR